MKTKDLISRLGKREHASLESRRAAYEAATAESASGKQNYRCTGCGRKIRRVNNPLVDGLCARCQRYGTPDLNAEPKAMNLLGRLGRETDKAIFFSPAGDSRGEIGPAWWPKSQCGFKERAMGDLDEISIPVWLLKQKQEEGR